MAEEVWAIDYGQMGKVWERVAERFKGLYVDAPRGAKLPSDRTCKERYLALLEDRKRLDAQPEKRSGSSEDWGELESLLTNCVDCTASHVQQSEERKAKDAAKKKEKDAVQQRLRTHTMASLSERGPSRSASRSSTSSLSSNSSNSSIAEGKSDGERVEESEPEGGHAKRVKPSLKLQREMLVAQQQARKDLKEQMERLAAAAEAQVKIGENSNILFEKFVNKL